MKFTLKKIKVNLLVKILAAIGLGIACGHIMPEWFGRISATFNGLFSQFLNFLIPLIILGFVAPAIAEIGKGAGKVLLFTAGLAYVATTFSGLYSFAIADAVFPSLIVPGTLSAASGGGQSLVPFFTVEIPAVMNVMTALVAAFMIGICLAYTGGKVLKAGLDEFLKIISLTIGKVIIPLLPVYIFGIFLNMTVTGQVGSVLGAFVKIIAVIVGMHVCLLLLQYCIAAAIVKRNPFRLLRAMLPAYMTALGTQSSAATIPVTLRQTISMGVREEIAGFVVPLCATIHMSGSAMKMVTCALALMLMQGLPYDAPMFIGFICMLGISIVAAPGVPGGAIMASLGLLASMLGFSAADQALMIALYISLDSFGTACNVTGDGFIALIVDKYFGRRKFPVVPQEELKAAA